MVVSKQFSFHAAHQLPNHNGQCRRLHGHTYQLELMVRGITKPVRPEDPRSDEGMVLDFSELKAIYKDRIEPLVEHQCLNETLSHLPVTTCEQIAWWIHSVFHDALTQRADEFGGISDVGVRLWETPTSYAETWGY